MENIVIPCVDQSSFKNEQDKKRFVDQLEKVLPNAEKYSMNLSLETDLDPQEFIDLLDRFDTEHVTVNYDTGNSAALGLEIELGR